MRIYQAKVVYKLISDGAEEPVLKPQAAFEYLRDVFDEDPVRENHFLISMCPNGLPIARHQIALGGLTAAYVTMSSIFHAVIMDHGFQFILVHNHPSGDISPSFSDFQSAQAIAQAGHIMRIPIYDFMMVGPRTLDGKVAYYSFRENGWPGTVDLNGKQYRTSPEPLHRPALPGQGAPKISPALAAIVEGASMSIDMPQPALPGQNAISTNQDRPAVAEGDASTLMR